MIEVIQLTEFSEWLQALRSKQARAVIARRIQRLAQGNPGDVEPLGGGISELRIHLGPGYRVYHLWRGETLVLLLCGGDKSTQARDIAKARKLAGEYR